jgi:hypothetical protein
MCVRPCNKYLISLYSIGFNKILCKVRFPILDIIVVKEAYNHNTSKLGVKNLFLKTWRPFLIVVQM